MRTRRRPGLVTAIVLTVLLVAAVGGTTAAALACCADEVAHRIITRLPHLPTPASSDAVAGPLTWYRMGPKTGGRLAARTREAPWRD